MAHKPLVILIHGLHQRGLIMQPLAKQLQRYGYRTHKHDYASLMQPIANHSARLNHWLMKHHDNKQPIHLVGHSLGGLVMRDFIHRYPQWQIGHCVTLGTPHLGSVTADYVKRLIPSMVGRAYGKGLDGNIAPLPDEICLGVIAGNTPQGLGRPLLSHYRKKQKLNANEAAHDGTVLISETKLPNAADHIILPVTHTGMLLDKTVAKQTAYFLAHGHFDHHSLKINKINK